MNKKQIFLSTFSSLVWGVLGLFFFDTLWFFMIPIIVFIYTVYRGSRHA